MFQDSSSLAAMAEALSQSPDYRVLRRLVARPPFTPSPDQETKTAIILDTETTGLDAQRSEAARTADALQACPLARLFLDRVPAYA